MLSVSFFTFSFDMYFRHKRRMSTSNQQHIAVLHGTLEQHIASDSHTFTHELYNTYKQEGGSILILQIARLSFIITIRDVVNFVNC